VPADEAEPAAGVGWGALHMMRMRTSVERSAPSTTHGRCQSVSTPSVKNYPAFSVQSKSNFINFD
jgi:hypothetical protein